VGRSADLRVAALPKRFRHGAPLLQTPSDGDRETNGSENGPQQKESAEYHIASFQQAIPT
jgi:hypothetical protein